MYLKKSSLKLKKLFQHLLSNAVKFTPNNGKVTVTAKTLIHNTDLPNGAVQITVSDTGVGVDAYSVIEQGKVSAMLEANPAERRLIFEEAAGISRFGMSAVRNSACAIGTSTKNATNRLTPP